MTIAASAQSPDRQASIAALLARAPRDLNRIRAEFLKLSPESVLPIELRIDIHDLIGRHRAVLDFVAQEIAGICYPPSKRPHFPIASLGKTGAEFAVEVDKKFKSLKSASTELRDYLLSIQHFNGSPWLTTLNELANKGKHDDLSHQLIGDFVAAYIGATGHDPAITLLGSAALVIEDGATVRINNSRGKPLRVPGPQRITVDSVGTLLADEGVYFKRVAWRDFHFDGLVEHTVVGLLEVFDRNLPPVVERSLQLVRKYHEARLPKPAAGTA